MDDISLDDTYLSDLPLWADTGARKVLEEICATHKIPIEVITELVVVQRERQHQERAHGINMRFEEILGVIE